MTTPITVHSGVFTNTSQTVLAAKPTSNEAIAAGEVIRRQKIPPKKTYAATIDAKSSSAAL